MAKITVNGKVYNGTNIVVLNGKVLIGKEDSFISDDKIINIHIEGDVTKMDIDSCHEISIKGNVENLRTSSGDVNITGDVKQDVQSTSGDIKIGGNVEGSINSTSGDIECKDVAGKVSTVSGDINHK